MKYLPLLAIVGLAAGAGCNSLDSPFADVPLLKTGRDARVFNVQTGEYEWPKNTTPRPQAAPPPARRATEPAAPASDGRPFDPVKGEFADPPVGR